MVHEELHESDRSPSPLRRGRTALVVACLAFTAAVTQAASVTAQDPAPRSYAERILERPQTLAYWRLGETSGTTARDERGGRHGTYAGGVELGASGALGADADKAARFDGKDDHVKLQTLPSSTSFTISGWQRLVAGASGNNTLYGSATTTRLMPRPAGFYADVMAGGRYALQGTAGGSNVDAWVHWALVRDGATLELYRDGTLVARRSDLPAATPTSLTGQIGRADTAYPAKGAIDEVAVINRALTAEEIVGDVASRDVPPGDGEPEPQPDPDGPFVVDGASTGGACSDAHTVAQAESTGTPWCTLGRAAQAAPDGSTVLVRAATYPLTTIDGTIGTRHLTFKPYGDDKPVLDGLTVTNSSFLRFERFRIKDVTDLDQVSEIQLVGNDISPHDVRVGTGRDLLFEDNHIHDLTMQLDPASGRCVQPRCGYGFRIMNGVGLTFRGNTFRRIPADGIQTGTAERYVIEDNLFEDITAFVDPAEHSDAIQFYGGSRDVVLRRNTFRQTRGPLFYGQAHRAAQHDLTIENNLFVNQRDWGIRIFNAPGLRLLNNTVWNARTGVLVNDDATIPDKTTGAIIVNNILDGLEAKASQIAREDHNLIASGYRAGPNDIAGPPRFVDAESGDYRLAGGSPGIDAGTSDGTPATDRVGNGRVDTAGIPNTGGGSQPFYDMGALEFTGTYEPPAGSYAEQIRGTAGLVAYWRLDESSGSTARDTHGDRDGSYANGPVLGQPGPLADGSTAVAFDGRDDHVTLPAMPSATDFTVEGWMRIAEGAPGNNGLFGQPGTLRFMPRPNGVYAGVWIGGQEQILQVTTAANTNQWVHWALVRRGTTLEIHRNGILVGVKAGVPTGAIALNGTIGRIGPTYPAKASIDEVAVYGTALQPAQLHARVDLAGG